MGVATLDTAIGVGTDKVVEFLDRLTRPVMVICCIRCGGTRRTLRRVDSPVKGYACEWCIGATNSTVIKTSKKGRVLVGPMAVLLGEMKAKK